MRIIIELDLIHNRTIRIHCIVLSSIVQFIEGINTIMMNNKHPYQQQKMLNPSKLRYNWDTFKYHSIGNILHDLLIKYLPVLPVSMLYQFTRNKSVSLIITSIAAWIKNTLRRTSKDNHIYICMYNYLTLSFFYLKLSLFY